MAKKKGKTQQNNKKKVSNGTVAIIGGQGNYYTEKIAPAMGKVFPKGSFAKTGGAIGAVLSPFVSANPYMPAVGKSAGSALGQSIARILGFGDYSVVNNTLSTVGKAISPGQPVPSFGVMGEATRIRHREYIADIVATGSAAFSNSMYAINPALATTFPWLNTLAGNYQQYIFNGLVFEFVSTASEYVSTIGMGTVILATDYDAIDAAYSDKRHMENSQYCVSAKPSMSQIHTIECLPSATANKLYYTRATTPPTNTDIRMYDLGNFQIAQTGITATAGVVLGELWCSYDVSLYKPLIGTTSGTGQKITPATAITPTFPFGTSPTYTGSTYFLAVGGNTLVCQVAGSYFISLAAACTVPTTPIFGGAGAVGMSVYAISAPLATTTTFLEVVGVTCTVGQLISIDTSLWATTAGLATRIVPYDRSVG